jgi:exosortase/archaeosortase family protein
MLRRSGLRAESNRLSAGVENRHDQRVKVSSARCAFLFGALIAELLGLTLCFETTSLRQSGRWFGPWVVHSNDFARWAITAAVATALFGDTSRWREHLRSGALLGSRQRFIVFFLAHATAFLAFAAITAVILGDDPGSFVHVRGDSISRAAPVIASFWFLAWAVAALAAVLFWCAACIPPSSWFSLPRAGRGAITIGIVVGSLAWIAAQLTMRTWYSLSSETFTAVGRLLFLAGEQVVSRPEQLVIGSPRFLIAISPQCSGYEGIGLVFVFVSALLWLSRRELQFPGAFLLLPIGTVVIWLANSVRIAALILLGIHYAPAFAVAGFHSQATWLLFNALAAGMVVGVRRLRFFERVDN